MGKTDDFDFRSQPPVTATTIDDDEQLTDEELEALKDTAGPADGIALSEPGAPIS